MSTGFFERYPAGMAGHRGNRGYIAPGRKRAYRAIKPKLGKKRAAQIANAGRTHAARSRMAKKAARTRRRRSR